MAGFLCLETSENLKNSKHPRQIQNLIDYAMVSRTKCLNINMKEFVVERGLLVFPKWRGFGIGKELLKCWSMVCKCLGFSLGIGIFTSRFSQACAKNAGLIEVNTISYIDLRRDCPSFAPENVEEHTESVQLYFVVT